MIGRWGGVRLPAREAKEGMGCGDLCRGRDGACSAVRRLASSALGAGGLVRLAVATALTSVGTDLARHAREGSAWAEARLRSISGALSAAAAAAEGLAAIAFNWLAANVLPHLKAALRWYSQATSTYTGSILVLVCAFGALMLRDLHQYRTRAMRSKFKTKQRAVKVAREVVQEATQQSFRRPEHSCGPGSAYDLGRPSDGARGIQSYFDDDEWGELDQQTGFDKMYAEVVEQREHRRRQGERGGSGGGGGARAGGADGADRAARAGARHKAGLT